MAEVRESVFIPTIKCLSCALDVEISRMGDHLCSGPPVAQSNEQQLIEIAFDDRPTLPPFTYGERMPPAVDTTVANRQYMRADQYTPISSSSDSRSISPRTPTARSVSGQVGDYFAPQIANDYSRTPSSSQGPPLGGYGQYEEPETYGDIRSHQKQVTGGLYQQVDPQAPGSYYANEKALPVINDPAMRQDGLDSAQYWPETSPTTYQSSVGPNFPNGRRGDAAGPALRVNGYGGFGQAANPSDATGEKMTVGYISRSDTFPKVASPMKSPVRKLSAPVTAVDRQRQSSSMQDRKRPSMGPITSRVPPPRTNLMSPTGAVHLAKNSVDLAMEFGIANPYHGTSDSASSGFSIASSRSSPTTSQSSPTRSYQYSKPSPNYYGDEVEALQSAMGNLKPTDLRVDPTAPPAQEPYSAQMEPPSGVSPGDVPRSSPNPSGQGRNLSPQTYSPSSKLGPSPKLRTDFSASGALHPFRNNSLPAHMQNEASLISSLSSGSLPQRRDSHDSSGLPSRGECKSCHLPIKGKSISSADGRLTGKYHKSCFVCSTCFESFSSTEFYVLNDKPYCERHYHKLNGSLCGSCGRGIEGQYLEDEAKVKYHSGCFRCSDCGLSLSDGYFEVDGKSYCEQHAWKRVQQDRRPPESDNRNRPQPPSKGPSPPRPPRAAGGLPSNPAARKVGGSSLADPRSQSGPQSTGRSHSSIVLMGLEPPGPQLNKRNTRLGMM